MARRSTPDDAAQSTILDVDVSTEMRGSFLEYAYSVIYARALPDARDGLKPVQRRILFQMSQMGLRPDRGHVKSARVVGDVMGKLHPHGDGAIYDALVRMAQPFSLRLPLVDGHGNFGSLDDGPAAARYTEARLAPAAMAMVADLDADVVDFVPNYDSQLTQPEVLPAALPNLLVNGASGIAVGMATNMPPHNLVEVVAALRHLLANPDAGLAELIRFVPGPDLPSGGKIVGLEGIRDAYATGRGSFRTRATARIENITARRKAIVVTELPYQVGPERVIEKIKDAVQSKKVQGITAVTDLTDREHGLRMVIEVKSSVNPEAVLAALYRYTPLEESFGINNVALVEGQPRTLGLRELLQVYLSHRITVVRRRTEYHLNKKLERAHLVEGLLVAIADIDEVIQVIRSSEDAQSARDRLMTVFDLSEAQAEYILALRLRRLTKYSRLELEAERDELAAEIEHLRTILADEALLHQVVGDELAQVAAEHGTPRRTVLLESAPDAAADAGPVRRSRAEAIPLEVPDTPCHVLLSATGLLARTADDADVVRDGARSAHDAMTATILTTARGQVAVLTNTGRLVRLSVVEIPALPPTDGPPSASGGVPVAEMIMLERGERVVTITSLDAASPPLALGTRDGVVKRVTPEQLQRDSWPVITLKGSDEVVGGAHAGDDDDLVFVTDSAQLLRFCAGGVRPQGRAGGGVAGVKLPEGGRVIHFAVVPQGTDAHVVTVAGPDDALPGTVPGSAKVTPLAAYPAKGRATGGVRAHRFLRGEDALYLAGVVPAPVRAVGSGGQVVDLPEVDERRDGSGQAVPAPIAGLG